MREISNIFTTNDKFDQPSGVVRGYKTTVRNDRTIRTIILQTLYAQWNEIVSGRGVFKEKPDYLVTSLIYLTWVFEI